MVCVCVVSEAGWEGGSRWSRRCQRAKAQPAESCLNVAAAAGGLMGVVAAGGQRVLQGCECLKNLLAREFHLLAVGWDLYIPEIHVSS